MSGRLVIGLSTFFVFLWATFVPTVHAQNGALFVATAASDDGSTMAQRVVDQIRSSLAARGDSAVLLDQLRPENRLDEVHSRTPEALVPGDLEALEACVSGAIDSVAFGYRERAQAQVANCLEIGDRALSALNREAAGAKNLFDSCLVMVRARLDLHDDAGARQDGVRCRRLVPDLEVDENTHPPHVRVVMAEIDRTVAHDGGAPLRVLSENGEPCNVFVNGRQLGRTPFVSRPLPFGSYDVQLQCDAGPTRLYRTEVAVSREARLRIDTVLDAALRTELGVGLGYASELVHNQRRHQDSLLLSRLLGSTEVFLVTVISGTVRVDRFVADEPLSVASARLPWDSDSRLIAATDRIIDAVASLRDGRSMDFTSEPAVPMAAWFPVLRDDLPPEPAGYSIPRLAVGWTSLGIGVVGHVASWILFAERRRLRDRFVAAEPVDPDFEARRQAWLSSQPAHLIAAGIAPVLSTLAMPLLLPEIDGVPWWSWIVGAVGLGVAGWGMFALAADGSCTNRSPAGDCIGVANYEDFGWVPLSQAPPLLAVPLTYLARHWFGGGVNVETAFDSKSAYLTLRGTL